MKYICIFFTLLQSQLMGQVYSYLPFPDSTGVWIDRYETGAFDQPSNTGFRNIECDIYVMQNDTLLSDSVVWKQVWVYGSTDDTIPEYYFGGLREDSAQKVWLLLSNDTMPFVIYDFGLKTGDTFSLNVPGRNTLTAVVIGDDSTYVPNRTLTLLFDTTMHGGWNPNPAFPAFIMLSSTVVWQEGKGCVTSGFIYFFDYTSNRTGWEYKQFAYHSRNHINLPEYSCIDYHSGLREFKATPSILLFPNPGNAELLINSNHGMAGADISVYSIDGKLFYHKPCSFGLISINTLSWNPGIYLVQMRSDDQITNAKWVKE